MNDAQNERQAEDIASDTEYQELTVLVPMEVLQRIENNCEARWTKEMERLAEDMEKRHVEALTEAARWRWLSVSLARKAKIPNLISTKLTIPSEEEYSETEQAQFDALLEKMELYLRMGQDFETLISGINSSEAVKSCWERLMVAMRLAGLDEIQSDD